MKLISKLAFCLGLLVCVQARANEVHSIDIDGVKRGDVLHVPEGSGLGAPLVVVLHGYGSSGADEMAAGRWQSKADKEKFIVAAPDALDSYDGVEHERPQTFRDWIRRNYQAVQGRHLERWDGGRNDVRLIASVIDEVSVEWSVDPCRIYIVGFLRGGFMADRMALEITDRLAAVAVVAPDGIPEVKKVPTRPLSFLLAVGHQDPFYPIGSERPALIAGTNYGALASNRSLSASFEQGCRICRPSSGGRGSVQRRHRNTLCPCPRC